MNARIGSRDGFGSPHKQRGITLFVALVMLVMVTLLAVSSFRVSNTNLKVVASMQGKGEATSAAQAAIEQVLSSAAFAADPAAVAAVPITVDMNGDGKADYSVDIQPKPACLKARPTNPAELDITKDSDRPCFGTALIGQANLATSCAETIWEVSAKTKDTLTGAETLVRQGVSMRTSTTEAESSCK
jgi:Tfp pilus assembly protein PilX